MANTKTAANTEAKAKPAPKAAPAKKAAAKPAAKKASPAPAAKKAAPAKKDPAPKKAPVAKKEEVPASAPAPAAMEKAAEQIVSKAASAFGSAMAALANGGNHAAPERNSRKAKEQPEQKQSKIEKDRETKNDVTRPSAGTVCATVWDLADKMSKAQGATVEFSKLVEAAQSQGVNMYTARTQYARWRKFNGITGRLVKAAPKEPKTRSRKPAAKPIA